MTDWDRIDALTDNEIDLSDIPELGDEFFDGAAIVTPAGRVILRATIDPELNVWLRSTGKTPTDVVNRALREYRERHGSAA